MDLPHDDAEKLDAALLSIGEALDEAHAFWHECADSYHDPANFRRRLNALVQAARNVTFRVQSQKSSIENFDDWYLPWQQYLKAHPVMKWASDARTLITKQKGLQAKSRAHALIISSYLPPGEWSAEFPADTPTEAIIVSALRQVPDEIAPYTTVQVMRRWEFDELPDREVLAALIEVQRVLVALVTDLVRFVDERTSPLPAVAVANTPRPECMDGLDEIYTRQFDAGTWDEVDFVVEEKETPPIDDKKMYKRVRKLMDGLILGDRSDPVAYAEWVNEFAKRVLVLDGFHTQIIWLRRPNGSWAQHHAVAEDKRQKFVMMQVVAQEVEKHGYDAIVCVGEAWMALEENIDADDPYPDLASAPGREEALVVTLATSDGRVREWCTPFAKKRGKIRLRSTEVLDHVIPTFLFPVFAVWGVQPSVRDTDDASA